MKTKALIWSLSGLMLIALLIFGGALCGSLDARTDWSLTETQASR